MHYRGNRRIMSTNLVFPTAFEKTQLVFTGRGRKRFVASTEVGKPVLVNQSPSTVTKVMGNSEGKVDEGVRCLFERHRL